MLYLILFLEFFKIGLFSVGGGLATLPFLYELADKYNWLDKSTLPDMIAVSQSTPGPLGINMATYSGFNAAGPLGGLIATVGLITPSVIIIIIIYHFLNKFSKSFYVQSAFYGLRPAVTALIATAGFEVVKISLLTIEKFNLTKNIIDLFSYKSIILFIVIFLASNKYKKHPIFFIVVAAIAGIIFKL